jgi:hypothetical protein
MAVAFTKKKPDAGKVNHYRFFKCPPCEEAGRTIKPRPKQIETYG